MHPMTRFFNWGKRNEIAAALAREHIGFRELTAWYPEWIYEIMETDDVRNTLLLVQLYVFYFVLGPILSIGRFWATTAWFISGLNFSRRLAESHLEPRPYRPGARMPQGSNTLFIESSKCWYCGTASMSRCM